MRSTIGEKIRTLRVGKGLTQEELGERLGYTKSFISHVENGTRSLSADDIRRAARELGVHFEDLVSERKELVVDFRVSSDGESESEKIKQEAVDDFLAYLDSLDSKAEGEIN